MPRRRGPKPNYVTFCNKPIEGLLFDKSTKSHYTYYKDSKTGKTKKKNLGRDLHKAIENLRKFNGVLANRGLIYEKESIVDLINKDVKYSTIEKALVKYLKRVFRKQPEIAKSAFEDYIPDTHADQDGPTVCKYIIEEYPDKLEELCNLLIEYAKDKDISLEVLGEIKVPDIRYKMPEELFWARVRKEILTNPYHVAKMTGIEEIGYLKNLPSPSDPYTLDEIANFYLERKAKPLSKKCKIDSSNWWNEFKDIVSKQHIAEITQEDINRYNETIHQIKHDKDYSSAWVSHRLNSIKTIFNYAIKKANDKTDIRRVIDYCNVFVYPDKAPYNPQPISKEDYHKLLNVADIRWRAILLISLNCGFYPKDIQDLKKSDIDFEKQELKMIRQKTKIVRVAILWNKTIEALNEYLDHSKHKSEHLFISNFKGIYKSQSIRDYFINLRKKANVSKKVKFEHLRDAAQSIPANNGCSLDDIRLLMGHNVAGVANNYLARLPRSTRKVCEVLEQHYFG